MAQAALEELEKTLQYQFQKRDWLCRALTHRSSGTPDGDPSADNEQLEFLGDAILGFIVSERLCRECPALGEGQLSRARAHLVSSPHLARVAQKLKVGKFLFLGHGEEKSGGRKKPALLADAVEALIAALYRDGGFTPVERFVETFILPRNLPTAARRLISSDHKSTLQELFQARSHAPPVYRVIREKGPEHRKTFTVEVCAGESLSARGQGANKKAAEQKAAQAFLQKFKKER